MADPLRHDICEIRKAAEQGAALTTQLLAFSRKQMLESKVVDLNSILANITEMLKRLIGENIDFQIFTHPRLGHIIADRTQIEQVFMNIVINARDAMPKGGKLTIETQNVLLDAEYVDEHIVVAPGRYVLVAVSDTGTGMEEAVRLRIFDPFFTTKDEGKGTGLGLSTVYGIVKQSNGYIWVYSEKGRGTTFKIYLPRVDEPIIDEPKPHRDHMNAFAGTETILLVDDNEFIRNALRASLEMRGYHVLQANGGKEAAELGQGLSGPLHLLITDVIMPGMDGWALAQHLEANHPQVKVILISGYTEETITSQKMLKPGISFLSKPFSIEVLLRKIRELLDAPA